MNRPRPAHYSFSAPQLSFCAKATSSTVYLASSPSSSCSLNLSDVDDSTFYDSTYVSQPFPATSRVPSETCTERRSSCSSTIRIGRKKDEEACLAHFDVSRSASRHPWRDVAPGGRATKLICTSVLAVFCCVLVSRLVMDKLSTLLNATDAIGALDSTNETEVVLALGDAVSESRPSSSMQLPIKKAVRRNYAGKTRAGFPGISGVPELRYRAPAVRRYRPVARPVMAMNKTATLPSAATDRRSGGTTRMSETQLRNTTVFASTVEPEPSPRASTLDGNWTRLMRILRASPQTVASAWLNVIKSATVRRSPYVVYIDGTVKPTSLLSTFVRETARENTRERRLTLVYAQTTGPFSNHSQVPSVSQSI
ncbi:hypothetical protein HPB51_018888 [Rhipicephalus microplus]|uniref:Uncharacterized protein n=1 Tax=Rhipicephalus microplus TaxID=6941 RepID=A0A9J6D6B0_RHIMP|nr:hypothetical protein HPB51_018888 [Rhipicephalus microplus]